MLERCRYLSPFNWKGKLSYGCNEWDGMLYAELCMLKMDAGAVWMDGWMDGWMCIAFLNTPKYKYFVGSFLRVQIPDPDSNFWIPIAAAPPKCLSFSSPCSVLGRRA